MEAYNFTDFKSGASFVIFCWGGSLSEHYMSNEKSPGCLGYKETNGDYYPGI